MWADWQIEAKLENAQKDFLIQFRKHKRMEQELVELKNNLDNERMIGGDSAYLELAAQKNPAVAAHFLRQTSKRLPSHSSIEYADADPLPEILPSRSHTETAV
ncbi:hypothetical protein QYM36_020093 [Artemia franciscana]|uniref:Uncharacterized protein n=1 Tax=Artemia franciscana TaxID=6661 RepID=A0AA88H985_ARTSF|nr:hypothetical protein QYM36_020093 [Artemia franciscana]